MKYFNPSYWFKMWVLSAPLFNSKNEGIYAKSIDNKKIKDWANKNTTDISLLENQELTLWNNQTSLLNLPSWNADLTTHNQHHKHRHQKSRNRHKRQHKINRPRIFNIIRILTVTNDNVISFFNNLMRIIREELNMQNIISRIQNSNSHSHNPNPAAYFINGNNQQYNYFSINININERTLSLFYRSSDLYLQGFISGNTYHYFNGDRPDNSDVLTDPQIENINTASLGFRGNYDSLISHPDYGWQTIINDFQVLANPQSIPNQIRESAIGVILATAESMRFQNVRFAIIQSEYLDIQYSSNFVTRIFTHIEQGIISSWDFFRSIITNWDSETQQAIRYFENNEGDLTQYFYNNIINRRTVISIFGLEMYSKIKDCNYPNLRSLNNEVCSIEKNNICNYNTYFVDKNKELYSIACQSSEIKKVNIQGKITTMKIVNKNNSENLKIGDFFVGTTEGLYLIRENQIVLKAANIDDSEIMSITKFKNNHFYVTTREEYVYLLNTRFINENNLLGQRLWNAESSNLEKELKIYYNDEKKDVDFFLRYGNKDERGHYKTINLENINPIDNYEKIEFLGNNIKTYSSWGNDGYWGTPIKNYVQDKSLNELIINKKIINDNEAKDNSNKNLQDKCDKQGTAGMCVNQRFGLTFYWDNKDYNYYFQVIARQYGETWSSFSGGGINMNIGNAIKLYNNDENIRTKRDIFNINNVEQKPDKRIISNELKNLTKWTDEFTSSINHEQNLPINNKTNFVTNNITSL